MKKFLAGLALTMFCFMLYEVKAGPPENAQKLMIPYPSICTPGMTEMMSALTEDYSVHISMTFEESPTTGIVVLHNPNTKTAAVLHVREDRTCTVSYTHLTLPTILLV